VALLLLGFAVREAEFNQVGSSNAASMWVFVASGLCLYALLFLVWTARRGRRRAK
jgi:heme/copper-type cytochrome/quinol oxidase subunit 3